MRTSLLAFSALLAARRLGAEPISPSAQQGALVGGVLWQRSGPLGLSCWEWHSLDRMTWYRFDFQGTCASWPGRAFGPAPEPYGERLAFGFWVREGEAVRRYRAEVFLPRLPRTLGGYAWTFLEGPRDLSVEGPVYAGTPLLPRSGQLTLTASCPKPAPGRCLDKPDPAGKPGPLYWPQVPVPTLGEVGEARALARKGGLLLPGEAVVRLEGREAQVATRLGTYRLGPGFLVEPGGRRRPFNGVIWAKLVRVEGKEALSFPLTLAGERVEALAPLRGEGLGLWSEGNLVLLGSGEVWAGLLAQRGEVEASPEVRVVGSVAAFRYTPLPLRFQAQEPPGFPGGPEVPPLLLRVEGVR